MNRIKHLPSNKFIQSFENCVYKGEVMRLSKFDLQEVRVMTCTFPAYNLPRAVFPCFALDPNFSSL